MSDVYSFGVVLLELITGKRSVDKSRPMREQDLVEWARPSLKDSHKLERIIDPRLEGQYSYEGARKMAALAHQCLSHQARSRPSMRTVVNTLQPLINIADIPVGCFVYVVPSEENPVQCEDVTEEKKKMEGGFGNGKSRRFRREIKVKPVRSSPSLHSDTALYKTLGTVLYSPNQAP